MTRSLIYFALSALLVVSIGCSGSNSPVAPSAGQSPELTGSAQSAAPSTEATEGHSLLGYWDCAVDPENGTVEFVPLRSSEFHFNVVPILEIPPMKIGLAAPPWIEDGVLNVDIKLTHPFGSKLQLSGFDVKGILITPGSETGFADPDIRIAGPHQTRLLNADGFTRWWNPAEFLHTGVTGYNQGRLGTSLDPSKTAILNGYKLFADGFDTNARMVDLDPVWRAFYRAGHTNSRHYEISLASGLKFNYAVDCSWAKPDPVPPVNLPDDFPAEANQAEPWFIRVTETNNTLWYESGEWGGNVNYDILVYDWQGVDDIGTLTIECPGIFSFTAAAPQSVDGNTAYYHFDVIMPDLSSADPLDVLVSVQVPGDYLPALTGVSKPLKAYHRHLTEVEDTNPALNVPPVASMVATTPTEIAVGDTVSFDGSASYDPDGIITQYLWDFNGDGIYGDSFTGDSVTPTHKFNNIGVYNVKLKVRDNSTGSAISDPVEVTVSTDVNQKPVAVAVATTETHILEDNTINFDGSGSYDPDGQVVTWAWDFNGDGVYNDPYTGDSKKPTHLFANPGTFYVDLKVFDNESGWDVLDTKIEVIIDDVPNVLPTASAVATSPTSINACGSVSFDATSSTDSDGNIVKYEWDFNGDGTYADPFNGGTASKPVKMFTDVGVFNVDVRVTDNEGGTDTLDTPIVVTVTNADPIAGATATTPTEIYGGDSVAFSGASSVDPDCDDIVSYEWDFDGDGMYGDGYDGGTDVAPAKVFIDDGTYDVMLRVTDGLGASDDTDSPIVITVSNHPPSACAEITSSYPYWAGDVDFSGGCSDDVDGTIVSWEWDLGADGSYEQTGEDVVFNFPSWGLNQMQIRVTDDDGESSLLDEPMTFWVVDADHMPPVISEVTHSRTTSQQGNNAEAVDLDVIFTDDGPVGDTHTFLWTCPYGSFSSATEKNPTWYPPSQVVKCDITVTVTDQAGLWDEGSCRQWVVQYAVIPGDTNGMIPAGTLVSYNPPATLHMASDFIGEVVYMNFWAQWCPPCKAELPHLTEVYDHFAGDSEYNQIMSDDESQAVQENYLKDFDYRASYWCIDAGSAYYTSTKPFGNAGYIPWHVIFDRDGRCRWVQVGSVSGAGVLITVIDQLL
jgi:PKD repeat protein